MTVSSSRRSALVPRWTLSTATPYILLTSVAIFSIALSFRLSPALGVIATFSAFFLMALPGVFIGMALFGWNVRQQPESLIFGMPLGLILSGYVALMLGTRRAFRVERTLLRAFDRYVVERSRATHQYLRA